MKACSNFILFAAIGLAATQVHAQIDDPNDSGGNGGSSMECPDYLLFSQGRHYYYQKKNCATSQMGNGIWCAPQKWFQIVTRVFMSI